MLDGLVAWIDKCLRGLNPNPNPDLNPGSSTSTSSGSSGQPTRGCHLVTCLETRAASGSGSSPVSHTHTNTLAAQNVNSNSHSNNAGGSLGGKAGLFEPLKVSRAQTQASLGTRFEHAGGDCQNGDRQNGDRHNLHP